MASNIKLTSYRSTTGNGILYLTPLFTYLIEIRKIEKKYVKLLYSSYKYSLTPIKINNEVKYLKKKNCTISISIEWIGAPKSYLLKNDYLPISIDEYKDLTKPKKRKRK